MEYHRTLENTKIKHRGGIVGNHQVAGDIQLIDIVNTGDVYDAPGALYYAGESVLVMCPEQENAVLGKQT